MLANVFEVPIYLFPQSGSPFDESLEVSLPEDFQILTVCENVWCRQVEVTPSKTDLNDASLG